MMSGYRVVATLGVLGAMAGLLSGCGLGQTAVPTRMPMREVASTGELGIGCTDLLTALPGWSLDPTLSPGPGTPSEAAALAGGTGCVFINGDVHLLIGIAHPDEGSASALRDYFLSNGLLTAAELGESALFDPVTGDAEVFEDGRWVTVVSDSFETASDAKDVLTAIEAVVSSHH